VRPGRERQSPWEVRLGRWLLTIGDLAIQVKQKDALLLIKDAMIVRLLTDLEQSRTVYGDGLRGGTGASAASTSIPPPPSPPTPRSRRPSNATRRSIREGSNRS
jgi:hypothetical protein